MPTSPALSISSRRRRLRCAIAVIAAIAPYAFAVWCEVAVEPGHVGHTEVLSWRRMASALSVTTWADFKHLAPSPLWLLELMTLLGVVGALLWLALRSVPNGAMARVVVWGYAVLLLSLGGWVSLIVLIDTPRQLPLDGEFLDESNARIAAIGIWFLLCLVACWKVRPRREQEVRPAAILTDERHEPA